MAGTLFSAIRTAFLLRRLLLPPGRR
jgi:hypothetical protein